MDKNKLKTFAIESRRQLIEDTAYQANLLGITKDGIQDPVEEAEGMQAFDIGGSKPYVIYDDDIEKRANLVKEVQHKGFENVIEEVAYTWFNRIIAIRYMEVNDYLPTRIRVLSSETVGKTEPDIIKEAPNIELNFNSEEIKYIYQLKSENKLDDLFQFLFIKQCNKLNEILPYLFEKTKDYNEILFKISYLDNEGIIHNLINNIPEFDFKNQVEIIGWLYQYYIFEKKNEVIDIYKGNIQKDDIPAATQLFTPDWIVKYMVDNTLGRYWIERKENSKLKSKLQYYIGEVKQIEEIEKKIQIIREEFVKPEDIKFFDPCMGSGHILVYAFDVFFEMYKELGFSEKEIPSLILRNNLFGLDIDNRAFQLAYFAILMKARFYDKQILNKHIVPNIFAIQESNSINKLTIDYLREYDEVLVKNILYLIDTFKYGKEFGSLIQLKGINLNKVEIDLVQILNKLDNELYNLTIKTNIKEDILPLVKQSHILLNKYEVVVTNPPYMKRLDNTFKKFAKKNYANFSKDLFSMFIYRNFKFCKQNGYLAFMSPTVWMYIKSYEKLREYLIKNKSFVSLIEFEYNALGEIGALFPGCTFILSNSNYNLKYKGIFIKLSDFTGGLEIQNQKTLDAIQNDVSYKFISDNIKFSNIPRNPIAYYANDNLIKSFNEGKPLQKFGEIKQGLATADNNRFLRFWFEVDVNRIKSNIILDKNINEDNFKWFPLNKGGKFRKWYGNQEYVINWENDGYELKNFKKSTVTINSNFSEFLSYDSLSWSRISSSNISFRYYPTGFLFDSAACSIFIKENFHYIFGFLNSKISKMLLEFLAPTLNFQVGDIALLPIIFNEVKQDKIIELVKQNIDICKNDWDDYETSWNFGTNPLIKIKNNDLRKSCEILLQMKSNEFISLKSNEEKLNELFSEIYSVDTNNLVKNKDIPINKTSIKENIKNFVSFVIGCLFGRYSLDSEGLVFAGGDFDLGVYSSFVPDDDNIVPVLDSEYFDDDVVGRFVEFVKVAFGEESLEENLDFIAGALKNKGKTSREVIRSYFLNDFFKDHVKMYKKCPIYWLFDSGKEDGFKCLVYMHRYSHDLVARVRTDYLHKTQKAIESQISYQQNIKENSGNSKDQARADKRIKKLTKQLDETRRYDEALAHVASQNISIDLDDGVKVNYAKFQNVEVSKEGQKVKKINLLKKI